ncbi:MAG: hypothetical protein AABY22_11765, partial [Nanoarchaeota archaeon]
MKNTNIEFPPLSFIIKNKSDKKITASLFNVVKRHDDVEVELSGGGKYNLDLLNLWFTKNKINFKKIRLYLNQKDSFFKIVKYEGHCPSGQSSSVPLFIVG